MKNLLKFEFYKLLRQRSFYVCLILMFIMSFISMRVTKSFMADNDYVGSLLCGRLSLLEALSTSNFTMLAGIFIALFSINDFSEQTIKNIYARGFSREKVYIAKYIVIVITTLIMFVLTMLFSLIVGAIMFKGSFTENIALNILGQFFYVIAITSFIFMTSYSIKRVGPAVAVALLGITIIGTALTLIDAFIDVNDFLFYDYWLASFPSDLISADTETKRIGLMIGLSAVYAVAFAVIGFFIAKNQED